MISNVMTVTCKKYESENVGSVGVLSADLPAVEVVRVAKAAAVIERLLAGVGQHGSVLLKGGLQYN
jgi:hypothetical protein